MRRTQLALASIVLATSFAVEGNAAIAFTQTPLVLGQVVRLEVTGMAPGDSAAFLTSFTGLGSGPCFPPTGVCLDILNPVTLLAILPGNALGTATIQAVVPTTSPLIPIFTQAVVIAPGGFSETNAIASSLQPIGALSDDFESGALGPQWNLLNPQLANISVVNGRLRIEPTASGPANIWYQDTEGPLVYRAVTGDFTVTAHVRAVNSSNSSQPPQQPYRLGGINVRNPTATGPGQKEYVHVAVGGGDASVPVAVEDKNTLFSQSEFYFHPLPTAEAELRITRVGSLLTMSHRPLIGGAWTVLSAYDHPAMPATVHVGMMAYSASTPAQLRVEFDDITFSP